MDIGSSRPSAFFVDLGSDEASAIIASTTDMAIVLDDDGAVIDVSCTIPDFPANDLEIWRTARIEDIVGVGSLEDLHGCLASTRRSNSPASCDVIHSLSNGNDLAIRYHAHPLRSTDSVLLLGREFTSLASLQSRMAKILASIERTDEDRHQDSSSQRSLSEMIVRRSIEKAEKASGRAITTSTGGETLAGSSSGAGLPLGNVPLKDLVRETTNLIEKDCIDTVLRLTGNNRALAARVLGLSRQSLYVKMRRYDFCTDADGD